MKPRKNLGIRTRLGVVWSGIGEMLYQGQTAPDLGKYETTATGVGRSEIGDADAGGLVAVDFIFYV